MANLTEPVALSGWGLLVALWLLRRQRVSGLAFWSVAATTLAYFWFSTPLGANLMVRAVEGDPTEHRVCSGIGGRGIVVALAGGVTGSASLDPPLARLKEASFRRTVAAAQLVSQHEPATLIVSGGAGRSFTEAELMRDLAVALDVPSRRIVVDSESTSTRASASRVAELVRAMDASEVHLVTSALHMPRAVWALEAADITVCRHPVDWKQVPPSLPGWLIPQISALSKSTQAVHEIAGLAWHRLTPARELVHGVHAESRRQPSPGSRTRTRELQRRVGPTPER